ncbi:DUF4314 domain-containing protein [Nocardia sp. NPDC059180]|uniref:DUF4314 domain-containing protein n=1 Tax=Nocardia sp. NPDC059180 TaxID=3346761 RepID=UPI0036861055
MIAPRIGDRVRITGTMADEPAPLPIGATGTVTRLGPGQIYVGWDNGRSLILLDTDPFQIIPTARAAGDVAGANPAEEMLARLRALRDAVDNENSAYERATGGRVESASDCAAHHDRLADLHSDIADLVAALDDHLSTGGQPPQAWASPTPAAPTTDSARRATVPARTLRGSQRLDNGKYVRAVSVSGDMVDIAFSDDTVWCSVPEDHPITLWDGRPSARAYPFAFLPHDEHQSHCPHQH